MFNGHQWLNSPHGTGMLVFQVIAYSQKLHIELSGCRAFCQTIGDSSGHTCSERSANRQPHLSSPSDSLMFYVPYTRSSLYMPLLPTSTHSRALCTILSRLLAPAYPNEVRLRAIPPVDQTMT